LRHRAVSLRQHGFLVECVVTETPVSGIVKVKTFDWRPIVVVAVVVPAAAFVVLVIGLCNIKHRSVVSNVTIILTHLVCGYKLCILSFSFISILTVSI